MADAEIEHMRKRMTHAAQMDAINRQEGKPAMHKLKLLPEVIMLLNRNQYIYALGRSRNQPAGSRPILP